jgi:hypothetical protein
VRVLSKGLVSDKKDNITFKASKKIKKKQVVVESSSSSKEDEDSDDDDDEGMTLFIKKYNKFIAKGKANKGYKGEKPRSKGKRICYNCGKHGHFIAQLRRSEDEDKKKKKKKKKMDKTYTKDKKDKKYFKKKSYGETHIEQEWDSDDESSSSDSEGMATIAIKGNSFSSKSLFPNLNKHTCLMAKENKKKVKVKNSSPQCTSSDDNYSND